MFDTTVARALSRVGVQPAGSTAYPRRPAPMLLRRADTMFAAPEWTYEPKWDGFRVLAAVRNGAVQLVSRNGHSFTALFGAITGALREFPVPILVDGEVVAISDKGHPDFQALQARLRPRNGKLPGHLCYMVFDCLYVNGHSLLDDNQIPARHSSRFYEATLVLASEWQRRRTSSIYCTGRATACSAGTRHPHL